MHNRPLILCIPLQVEQRKFSAEILKNKKNILLDGCIGLTDISNSKVLPEVLKT